MNKARRKEVDALRKLVEVALAHLENMPDIDEHKGTCETLVSDEQETFDALPESLQTDERQEPLDQLSTAFDKLSEIADNVTAMRDDLQEVLDALDAARGG